MNSDQKNLFTAVALVIAILLGFHYFYERPRLEQEQATQTQKEIAQEAPVRETIAKQDGNATLNRDDAMKASAQRIVIKTPKLSGSINLQGGMIDDLKLLDYKETTDKDSAAVTLLSPEQAKEGYLGQFTWTSAKDGQTATPLITDQTPFQSTQTTLEIGKPVTLTYHNEEGVFIERKIEVDENYMFKITDEVTNKTQNDLTLKQISTIERRDIPLSAQGGFILHEGPIGVVNGKLHEIKYDKLTEVAKLNDSKFTNAKRSWIGFTDKYWLTALIPNPEQPATLSTFGDHEKKMHFVQAESENLSAKAGKSVTNTVHFFAGAKVLELLDSYEHAIGFDKFDLAVDFGWFYFLTKPLLYVLQFLHKFFGNFGLAILALTVLFKLAFFPLANKSYRSMSRMRTLQPQIEALKARYGEDKMRFNQALMELYKKESVNPVSGCLPMIIQAPVFFCLYKVLYVSLEMRHAPFYGWIHDLSAPDPTSLFNLFGLLPFTPPHFLQIGLWPILMGLSMWLQQKLNPQPADKAQATMFLIMPLMLTFLFASFPAGLVIYWVWSNVLGIVQQWAIMRMEASRVSLKKK